MLNKMMNIKLIFKQSRHHILNYTEVYRSIMNDVYATDPKNVWNRE